MKTWFKARLTWGAGIDALTDDEAGRFAKALWQYERTYEETELQGTEKVLFALALMELRQDEQAEAELSNVRAEAGRKGGKQTQAKQAIACFDNQNEASEANATNKNKNKNKNIDKEKEKDSSSITTTPFGDVPIDTVQNYAQQYLVGLTSTHLEEIDQYSEIVGEELVKHAIDESIANGVRSWAYVRAILRGYMKDNIKTIAQAEQAKESHKKATASQGRQVTAQQYEQREYTERELEARTADILNEALGVTT